MNKIEFLKVPWYSITMEALVERLVKANESYRNGGPLLMTDDEYDAGLEALKKVNPKHPLLTKVRASPSGRGTTTVRMPYYLGSLDKAKTSDELSKWLKKVPQTTTIVLSEKLDGISGFWNPKKALLYLSGDDNMGVDVSSWLPYISKGPSKISDDISDEVWIRGELILPKSQIPEGRLGRSIINGIFHHKIPNPTEAAKVRFIGYEIIGMHPGLTVTQQFSWLQMWNIWLPWSKNLKTCPSAETLTKFLADRRSESEYDLDGLVIKTNIPIIPRVIKGNPKDAIAWKPPNGETKLTKVVNVEWNASASGKLIPRVEIEPVQIGGSTITFVTGVNARRVVDWKIGKGATVVIRKGGDVIPLIESVEVPACVEFPKEGTWEWDGSEADAVNIKQRQSDSTTIIAQYMKMATTLNWETIGPAVMKSVVDAGFTTIPLLRKVSEETLKKLLGKVKGATLYRMVQKDGWAKATEIDLFIASPICRAGIGKARLEALLEVQPNVELWSSPTMIAPKGWSIDALKDFQTTWRNYEKFRKDEWSFMSYPISAKVESTSSSVPQVPQKGSVVFTGFRDNLLEQKLLEKGYKLIDTVNSTVKAVFIADSEDPVTYTSTKIEKAKKLPGCSILRRSDWNKL